MRAGGCEQPAGFFWPQPCGLLACLVTFTQQATSFCRQADETPKKAAVAAVFVLPRGKAKGLNFR
jgi:hypothetical protein